MLVATAGAHHQRGRAIDATALDLDVSEFDDLGPNCQSDRASFTLVEPTTFLKHRQKVEPGLVLSRLDYFGAGLNPG